MSRKLTLRGVAFEEIESAAGYDVVKILTEDPETGADAEFDWLQFRYPGASMWKQTLTAMVIRGKRIDGDMLSITLEDGTRRKIIFDISMFFGKRRFGTAEKTSSPAGKLPEKNTELDFLEFNEPVLTGKKLENETKKIMSLIDAYSTYSMNDDTERKQEISSELIFCFCDGRGREILNALPVDYVLNLANCNLPVYINRDCYKLAGSHISKHRDYTGLAYVYAGNIAVEAAAFVSNSVCNAGFANKTLQFFCDEMKNLSEINPASLYIQEQYTRILYYFTQYPSARKKAKALCKRELDRLAAKYPDNEVMQNPAPEASHWDSSLELEKKFILHGEYGGKRKNTT